MRLPRRETPTPPRELASFPGHTIAPIRKQDAYDARRLLTRMSVSFAGIASRAMHRAICASAAGRGTPTILVARRGGRVVGVAIATETPGFWRSFFVRHPLLGLAALLHRWGQKPAARGGPEKPTAPSGPSWSESGPGIAKILFIGVDSEHRCRGLAAHLYAQLMVHLARAGATRVDARIGSGNVASIRLHERTGWTLRPDEGCVFATRSLR